MTDREFQPVKFTGNEFTVRDLIVFNEMTGLEFSQAVTMITSIEGTPTLEAIKIMVVIYWLLAKRSDSTLTHDECLDLSVAQLTSLIVSEDDVLDPPDG